MKKKNWIKAIVAAASFSMILAGCGSAGTTGAGEKPSQLNIATGGTAGTYYPLGGGLAKIITDKAKVNATAQATGASVENLRLIKDGQADIAFTQSDIADYGSKGTLMFAEKGKIGNFRALAALYPETVQLVVAANSAVKSVEDLKGKKVSVGAPGSGTEANAQQILEAYGLKFADINVQRLSFAESTSGLKEGAIDAAFQTAGVPTSAITELGATKGVRIIPIDDQHFKTMKEKYPYYSQYLIPAKTYTGQDSEVKTVAVQSMLVARAELDTTLVYNITKALFENLGDLGAVHAKGKEITLDKALEGVSIEVHPGADKYYKEKGVKK